MLKCYHYKNTWRAWVPNSRITEILIYWLICVGLGCSQAVNASELNLPDFGHSLSGTVSPIEEKRLGQLWMRRFRSQAPISSDPIIIDYLSSLLNKLAQNSQLHDRNLDLLLVKHSSMNAFAVPGNIIGVHTGLLIYSHTEAQLASVLSHELAHLSQRHYARQLEQQNNMRIPFYAALLASLVLAANTDGSEGIAAISATQAAMASSQLRFSRQYEQEADRLGIETLIASGYSAYAAAEMFEEMLKATRFSRRAPDFLLTHPVTESRISDAKNRALNYEYGLYKDNIEYQLMRNRIRVGSQETPQSAIKYFLGELEGQNHTKDASQYGLTLAYNNAGDHQAARIAIAPLLRKDPARVTYLLMDIDIDAAEKKYTTALLKLQKELNKTPNNYPINTRYAEVLMQAGHYQRCVDFLSKYIRTKPNDPYLWYILAEVSGLSGDILGVHEARAEYFIQTGIYDRAMVQLRHGLKLSKSNDYKTALLTERLRYAERIQSNLNF